MDQRTADNLAALRGARALIEKGWARGTYATNADGRPVGINDPDACNFCAVGALRHTVVREHLDWVDHFEIRQALDGATREALVAGDDELEYDLNYYDVVLFNDRYASKAEDVLAIFDKAIASFEQGEVTA